MKKEIIVLYGLYALICSIGLCFLFKANDILLFTIKWYNKDGTYNTIKPTGLSVFGFCYFIAYNILKKILNLRAELKEFDDFLND
jgi:hypothetical protein